MRCRFWRGAGPAVWAASCPWRGAAATTDCKASAGKQGSAPNACTVHPMTPQAHRTALPSAPASASVRRSGSMAPIWKPVTPSLTVSTRPPVEATRGTVPYCGSGGGAGGEGEAGAARAGRRGGDRAVPSQQGLRMLFTHSRSTYCSRASMPTPHCSISPSSQAQAHLHGMQLDEAAGLEAGGHHHEVGACRGRGGGGGRGSGGEWWCSACMWAGRRASHGAACVPGGGGVQAPDTHNRNTRVTPSWPPRAPHPEAHPR